MSDTGGYRCCFGNGKTHEKTKALLSSTEQNIEANRGIAESKFEQEEELERVRREHNEVMERLNPNGEEQIFVDDGEDGETQYQIRYPQFSEDDITKNSIALQKMDPVGHYTGNELGDRNTSLRDRVRAYFDSLGNNIYTERFGDVALRNSSIRSEFRHGSTPVKAITYVSIPDVLRDGQVIYKKVKNEYGTERIVVAAPVTIGENNEKLYVAVMLQRDPQSQRLYLHDAITEKELADFDGRSLNPTGLTEEESKLFTTDILQRALRVKQEISDISDSEVQYQQRTSPLTDRDVLTIAANTLNIEHLTDAERAALDIFKRRIDDLNQLTDKRSAEGQKYKELQFGEKPDRAEAQKTLNRMHVLDEQIKKANDAVLDVQNKEVLRKVLSNARRVIEQDERAHGKEMLRRYRDRMKNSADIRKYRERIRKDTDDLKRWISNPMDKNVYHHVPLLLQNNLIHFLEKIDFTSNRQLRGGEATKADAEFVKGLKSIRDAIRKSVDAGKLYSEYTDLPPGFMEELQKFIDSTEKIAQDGFGPFIINRMTADELKTLSKLVRVVKTVVFKANQLHQNAVFGHVYEAGESTIGFTSKMSAADKTGKVSDFLLWQQMRPAYAFERFGEGGISIFKELQNGQSKLAFITKEIEAFRKKTYKLEEYKEWRDEIKEFDLGGDHVMLPATFAMSLYELWNRPQARGHLLSENGGIRVATYTNGNKKISDTGHKLTEEDIKAIIGSLSERQKNVADALQNFMAKRGGELGNYVSLARFGVEQFGEKEYFPIYSDGRHLEATTGEAPSKASLYALLNMSFTKELSENANSIYIQAAGKHPGRRGTKQESGNKRTVSANQGLIGHRLNQKHSFQRRRGHPFWT